MESKNHGNDNDRMLLGRLQDEVVAVELFK